MFIIKKNILRFRKKLQWKLLIFDQLTNSLNPYKVGLFWRFPPLHNFGTIYDDIMKLSTNVLHQQRNKLTSLFFWWRHYSSCDVIVFVKLWPVTLCHSRLVYSRCTAYCKMYYRFWQGKVSIHHILDSF